MADVSPVYDGLLAAMVPSWLSNKFSSCFVAQNAAWTIFLEKGRIQEGGIGVDMLEPTAIPTVTGPQVQRTGRNVLQNRETSLMTGSRALKYTAAHYSLTYALDRYAMNQFGAETEKASWAEMNSMQAIKRQLFFVEADWWAAPESTTCNGQSDQYVGSLQAYINSGTATATDGGALPPARAEQSAAPFVVATGTVAITNIGGLERAAVGMAYLAASVLTPASSVALTIQELDKGYTLACVDGEEPDLIIMPLELMSVLQNLSSFGGSNGGQLVNDPGSARMGHRRLFYRNAEIICDDRCPKAGFISNTSTARTYNIFYLNTKYLTWRMVSAKPESRLVPDARYIFNYTSDWMLQFTMKGSGRYHARHISITAP